MNESPSTFSSIVSEEAQASWDTSVDKCDILNRFFEDHVNLGLISNDTLKEIDRWTDVPTTQQSICLQLNSGRLHRGVVDRLHPAPNHIIPFKGGVPCFCCPDVIHFQWPTERAIKISLSNRTLFLLPNISPIFNPHFTIVSELHLPQTIDIRSMIEIAELAPKSWVIQNGPDAGATNPWHFHLQLFYRSHLPLESFPFIHDRSHILDHPALIYRYSNSNRSEFEQSIRHVAKRYLNLSDTRRLNLLISKKDGYWIGFLICRDTRFTTGMYKKGQPGYAEPAGFISAVDSETHDRWKKNSVAMYSSLMSDIRPIDSQTLSFLADL